MRIKSVRRGKAAGAAGRLQTDEGSGMLERKRCETLFDNGVRVEGQLIRYFAAPGGGVGLPEAPMEE
ncbi:hypothetical protein CIC12_01630 [Burkholderia sp. SG-MS1]|nr:hypothetical protein [Paraburkholderia sp. SG-MS1]